jgi:hypothetical protein
MRRTSRVLIFLAVVGGVLAAAAAVFAYFTADGVGQASATVGTLNAPTNVAASATNGSSTVHVTWTGVTPPSGTLNGYYVQRHSGATATNACGSSPSSLVAGTSCDDTSVADGTYTYTVVAIFRSWTATSTASSSVMVVGDVTAPTATLTFPTNGGVYNSASFGSGCTAVAICGSAADSTGVQSVSVSVLSIATAKYWDGSGFNASSEQKRSASLTNPGGTATNWKLVLPVPADGQYTVKVYTQDTLGHTQSGAANAASASFTIDDTAPTVQSITRAGSSPTNANSLSWTVTFSEPVVNVAAGDFGVTTTNVSGTAPTVNFVAGSNATWTVTVTTSGAIGANNGTVRADLTSIGTIQDAAGNALSTATPFQGATYAFDTTKPTVTVEQAVAQGDPTKTSPITFTATFSEAISGFTNTDVTISGTGGGTPSVSSAGGNAYTITVTPAANGTVIATIPAGGVTDAAGNTNAASTSTDNTVTYDTVAPTISAVAIAPTNVTTTQGFLHSSVTYYVYANVSDAGSGIASVTANVTNITTGTTAAPLTAGSYSAFGTTYNYRSASLTAKASLAASTYTVTATDNATNATTTANQSYAVDSTAPTGNMTAPTAEAFVSGSSVSMTSNSADAGGAGVASAVYQVAPTGTSTWTDIATDTTSPYSVTWNSTAQTDGRYDVRVVTTDNAGNTFTSAVVTVEVENGAPQPTNLQLQNGGSTQGKIEAGDSIVLTYSEALKVSSLCSSWATDSADQNLSSNGDVTVTVTDGGASNDTMTATAGSCTFNLGTINLGATGYTTGGNMSFGGSGSNKSTIAWSHANHALTITLGGKTGSGTAGTVTSSTATYTPSGSIQNHNGTAISGTFATSNVKQF